MTEPSPTSVTILAGFLGAGKTTLLNRILRGHHGRRIGVLVNDFGAVNIDARLVATMDVDTVSLTNGCVCCSMRGDLVTGVKRILAQTDPPNHLVVEASGISDPLAIASTFSVAGLRDQTSLDGVISLVDAENVRNPRLDAQLVENQIRAADIVVLNKADLVDRTHLEELREWIRSVVPGARIIEAVHADIPLNLLLGAGRDIEAPFSNHQTHDHPHEYGTWRYRTGRRLAYRRVRTALESLPAGIFRGKGVLTLADAPNLRFVAQLVGRRVAIDVAGPWASGCPETELVFIGQSGAISEQELRHLFDGCATRAIPLVSHEKFRKRANML